MGLPGRCGFGKEKKAGASWEESKMTKRKRWREQGCAAKHQATSGVEGNPTLQLMGGETKVEKGGGMSPCGGAGGGEIGETTPRPDEPQTKKPATRNTKKKTLDSLGKSVQKIQINGMKMEKRGVTTKTDTVPVERALRTRTNKT